MLRAGLLQRHLHLCYQILQVSWLLGQVCRRWKLLQVCLLTLVLCHCWTLLRSFLLAWACWLPPLLPPEGSPVRQEMLLHLS